MKKGRGKFLTIMILYGAVSSLFALYGIFTGFLGNVYAVANLNVPSWYHPYGILANLLMFVALYQIWNWQKNGVYLLVGLLITGFVVASIVSRSIFGLQDTPSLIGSFIGMVLAYGLWFWAIYRKWKYFV